MRHKAVHIRNYATVCPKCNTVYTFPRRKCEFCGCEQNTKLIKVPTGSVQSEKGYKRQYSGNFDFDKLRWILEECGIVLDDIPVSVNDIAVAEVTCSSADYFRNAYTVYMGYMDGTRVDVFWTSEEEANYTSDFTLERDGTSNTFVLVLENTESVGAVQYTCGSQMLRTLNLRDLPLFS